MPLHSTTLAVTQYHPCRYTVPPLPLHSTTLAVTQYHPCCYTVPPLPLHSTTLALYVAGEHFTADPWLLAYVTWHTPYHHACIVQVTNSWRTDGSKASCSFFKLMKALGQPALEPQQVLTVDTAVWLDYVHVGKASSHQHT